MAVSTRGGLAGWCEPRGGSGAEPVVKSPFLSLWLSRDSSLPVWASLMGVRDLFLWGFHALVESTRNETKS